MSTQKDEWRCFHCDEVFTDPAEAALHFGESFDRPPYCGISAAEVRALQRELDRYRQEDTSLHREIAALHASAALKIQRAEEQGYARGLADAKRHPEELGLVTSKPEGEP